MKTHDNSPDSKVETLGFISLSLLIIAKLLVWTHLPNGLLFIVAGILFFNFAVLPVYLVQRIRNNPAQRFRHWLLFISAFIFNISFLLAVQQEFVPQIVTASISLITGLFLIWYFTQLLRSERVNMKKFSFIYIYVIFTGLIILNVPFDVQAPDYQFKPYVHSPAYHNGSGPLILIDQAHNNIHTLDHRLVSTGRLLENDGYNIKGLDEKIETIKELEECKIYVIVNALSDQNLHEWKNPTFSAFTDQEIGNINDWVKKGGSLLLIIDHMPLPGAAYELAKSFGFELKNGHTKQIPWKDNWFFRVDSSLTSNVITNGRNNDEMLDSILAFGGSAFLIPEDANSILELDSAYYQWEPDIVWDFKPEDRYPAAGFSMGAYKTYGKGKVVIFSEAMMFTAQLGGGFSWLKLGMNHKDKPQNYQLLLNTIHWLDPQILSLN